MSCLLLAWRALHFWHFRLLLTLLGCNWGLGLGCSLRPLTPASSSASSSKSGLLQTMPPNCFEALKAFAINKQLGTFQLGTPTSLNQYVLSLKKISYKSHLGFHTKSHQAWFDDVTFFSHCHRNNFRFHWLVTVHVVATVTCIHIFFATRVNLWLTVKWLHFIMLG